MKVEDILEQAKIFRLLGSEYENSIMLAMEVYYE